MEHVPLFLHSAGNVTHRMSGLHNKPLIHVDVIYILLQIIVTAFACGCEGRPT